MEPALSSTILTPSAPVAAVQASQLSDCAHCHEPLQGGALTPHLCGACGLPQPLSDREDYFSALHAPRKFGQDPAILQKRFYEVSRGLHPDRFSASGSADAVRLSQERMSFLNQAYSTLKDPELLRSYLIEKERGKSSKPSQSQMPLELAEAWFELQDLMTEDPEQARDKAKLFKAELNDLINDREDEIRALEAEYDRSFLQKELEAIAQLNDAGSYLRSLQRDVEKLVARLGNSATK